MSEKDTNDPAADAAKSARKKATLMSLPFAAMGFLAFMIFVHDGLLGGLDRDKAIKLGSVMVVAAGFVVLIFGIVAKRTSLAQQLKKSFSEDSVKPWLRRPDWAAGRIKSSGIPDEKSYLTMAILFCVIGVIIAGFMVPLAIRTKNFSDLVGLFFPMVGIIILTRVIQKMRASKRFGDCSFEMPSVPASPGGALQGTIRTALPLLPGRKMDLAISCIRRTVAGAGQHRRAEEKVLWNEEITVKTPVASATGGGAIPVLFELPPNQPQCSLIGNETISWRLEAKMPQVNFHATFDVPVFKVEAEPGPVDKAA
ncbi:MAG TPA: hypothetical protein VGI03_09905 [Verrucomicrobiae bacterium]|jgi:hypothetical protein